ncbi:MAG TPA: hypothetical protein VFB81_09485 [Myxococcales bacterium]|nr:hypothetical protein [Myxococcales bacterium]
MKNIKETIAPVLAGLLVLAGTAVTVELQQSLRDEFNESLRYTSNIEFPPRIGNRGDPDRGRAGFGIGADGVSQDPSQALFEGFSLVAGEVHSNGRTCATCHRPDPGLFLGLPPLPLSASIPADDVLFTGLVADTGDDPLGLVNFDQLGLLLHRPTRFNPLLPPGGPQFRVFFWRKTQRLINTVFTFGLLNDGRMRELVETTRGALFTHTQNGDLRFDDITNAPPAGFPATDRNRRLLDISRFMEEQIDPPELRALLDPNHPDFQRLSTDPFATVPIKTGQQRRGSEVFQRWCMTCHNMPNVFSNRDHVNNPPTATPPPYGHTFDIGISQRNLLDLEFRFFDITTGQRVPIVLPLVKADGTTVHITVVDDVGLAGATGRYEDLHKFKVPQLRRISQLGPFFHDNTVPTLEGVVDYFNGPEYNSSPDGQRFPIHLTQEERATLLAFLRIL